MKKNVWIYKKAIKNGVIIYKCSNFIKKEKESKIHNKFIKFEYLDEFNKLVVVVIKETPKNILDDLKLKYDEIKILN